MTVPVGHSARWGYLETAAAMLVRETGDAGLQKTLETAWERMVSRLTDVFTKFTHLDHRLITGFVFFRVKSRLACKGLPISRGLCRY